MCDVQGKLVAWLDQELSPDEGAGVQRHLEGCEECRSRLAAYERMSETFDVYCDAVAAAKRNRRIPRWVPVLASAVVTAALVSLVFPRRHIELPPVLTPTTTAASVALPAPPKVESAPRKTIHKRHAVSTVQEQAVKWQPTETVVQVAIPAEAMFPPGAMPKGLNFIAELSIAPDGSVKQVRLRQ